ncbi:hypothetical protein AKG37_17485 [Bacillus australimaris]|uniref:ParB/Sulfiredoxin domain-containing protein n=1 Tax=Bacillus australimaris TaxID=1326968 RepID=A0ABD4QJW2_9BACI|nr:hypothetical protein [Bacillus australimaris]KPN14920.1 hypothetical protein AKG37_17485 [Bacillus australimaris]MBR8689345.1 hypothetical protein [Bacillus australimaris]
MFKTMKLDPTLIKLDLNNPRFSLFKFSKEEEIIDYLIQYEDVKSLAQQIIKNGYVTLGERVIVLEKRNRVNTQYVVLEGNRRIAALKIIFKEKQRLSSSDRREIEKLNIDDFMVHCDVIDEDNKDEALFKITAKHIEGIKEWRPSDKRIFYDNLFTQHKKNGLSSKSAIEEIEKVTPEKPKDIKNAIKQLRFLNAIHNSVKSSYPELKELSHLENDVLISRVWRKLKKTLNLKEDDNFYLLPEKNREEEFQEILKKLGEATWITCTLNTRTFNTQKMWDNLLEENKVVPGLKQLIKNYIEDTNLVTPATLPSDATPATPATPPSGATKGGLKDGLVPIGEKDGKKNSVNEVSQQYKLFVKKNELTLVRANYDTLNNIKVINEQGEILLENHDIYSEIAVYSDDNDIAIINNKISALSKNGEYNINIRLNDIVKTYKVYLNIPFKKSVAGEVLFSEEWYQKSFGLLAKKEEYSNIVSVLNCLEKEKDISTQSDKFVIIAFLIRVLLEYSSKAYWDKHRNGIDRPSDLTQLISKVSAHLYDKEIINKELKKSFGNGKDIETLNGKIHDYRSNISSITLKTIFKAYQTYLDKLFAALS